MGNFLVGKFLGPCGARAHIGHDEIFFNTGNFFKEKGGECQEPYCEPYDTLLFFPFFHLVQILITHMDEMNTTLSTGELA